MGNFLIFIILDVIVEKSVNGVLVKNLYIVINVLNVLNEFRKYVNCEMVLIVNIGMIMIWEVWIWGLFDRNLEIILLRKFMKFII